MDGSIRHRTRWRVATAIAAIGTIATIAGLLGRDGHPRGAVGAEAVSATPNVATRGTQAAALVNPFSRASPGRAAVPHDDESPAPAAEDPVAADTSQDQHIAESRRNHLAFQGRPAGYLKYEALARVHPEDIGLDKAVHDQYLLYHGRLAFEELRYQIGISPSDFGGNAERYGLMLDIIARAPCLPDEHWNECIRQSLGMTRADVEAAQADASALRDERNLAQLKAQLARPGRGEPGSIALYESLKPLLAQSIAGDEETIRRFGLAPESARAIITAIDEPQADRPQEPEPR